MRTNFSKFYANIHIFADWSFVTLKKLNSNLNKNYGLFIFSSIYFFNITWNEKFLISYYNFNTFTISFRFTYVSNFFQPYWKIFKIIYFSFFFFFLKRLKFKGKGYYIFKNKRNTITFRFGYSHRIYLYFYKLKVKFLSKTSIFIYGLNTVELIKFSFSLKNIRPYNLFTGKGIRFNRQIIYKKTGKASTYV